jgi:hypothetical protein
MRTASRSRPPRSAPRRCFRRPEGSGFGASPGHLPGCALTPASVALSRGALARERRACGGWSQDTTLASGGLYVGAGVTFVGAGPRGGPPTGHASLPSNDRVHGG